MTAPLAAQPITQAAGSRCAAGATRRRGFTLVELLVVLLIVGMLAAILTPVVMQSLAKARNAGIKAEIDMLHMAIMNYKNEYGSFPPTGLDPTAPQKHLQRLFPRAAPANLLSPNSTEPTPYSALYRWLSGYTNSPTDPLNKLGNSGKINKLFDFDQSRVTASSTYHPSQKPNSPYLYIPSSQYELLAYQMSSPDVFGAHLQPPTPTAPPPANNKNNWLTPLLQPYGPLDPAVYSQRFFNPDTFQIISAGRDEVFGTDDDLSNFWPATRGEYLESLTK